MTNRLINSALILTAGFVVMQTILINNNILTKTQTMQSEIQFIRESYKSDVKER